MDCVDGEGHEIINCDGEGYGIIICEGGEGHEIMDCVWSGHEINDCGHEVINPSPKLLLRKLGQPNVYTSLLIVPTTIINTKINLKKYSVYLLINVIFVCCAMPM